MFQFPAFAPRSRRGTGIASGGLPHSEIHGSGDICSSPWLIAACHVLLRLREPRHPPCALDRFRYFLTTSIKCMSIFVLPLTLSLGFRYLVDIFCFARSFEFQLLLCLSFLLCVFSLADLRLAASVSLLPLCQCALSKASILKSPFGWTIFTTIIHMRPGKAS